jgi:hypothetical protein
MFHRFQQEAVAVAHQFDEGSYRSFKVGKYLCPHWDNGVLTSKRNKFFA